MQAVKKEQRAELGYGYHSVTKEEQRSIANWINSCFLADQDLDKGMGHILPLKDDGSDLYSKVILPINPSERSELRYRVQGVEIPVGYPLSPPRGLHWEGFKA